MHKFQNTRKKNGIGILAGILALSLLFSVSTEARSFYVDVSQAEKQEETPSSWADACAAYLTLLQQNRNAIEAYDWQKNWSLYAGDIYTYDGAITYPAQVSVADICGDETPELIFISADTEYTASLKVYTYSGGAVLLLLQKEIDWQAAGGYRYCLFQEEGDKHLWLYSSYGDEMWTYTWEEFDLSGSQLSQCYVLSLESEPNDTYTDTIYTYRENLTDVTYEQLIARRAEIASRAAALYQYNWVDDETTWAGMMDLPCQAMSYSDAEAYLASLAGVQAASGNEGSAQGAVQPQAVLAGVPQNFMFTSGAGAWGTGITLYSDGTFTGEYQDSNMGQDMDKYPGGVCYVCEFSGAFSDFEMVDPYTYRMRLSSLTYTWQSGEEWDSSEGIHYIATEALGIAGGDVFYLYLKGRPTADLPDEFLDWVGLYMGAWGRDQMPAEMTIWGIYNEAMQYGFGSYGEPAAAEAGSSVSSGEGMQFEGMLFPDSDVRILTESDITGFSKDLVQTAVNEIYARHGYLFQTPEVLSYFQQFSWYQGTVADMQAVFDSMNETEKANVNFLSRYL